MFKVRRNDPCPCGSGKKYKNCCLGREDNPVFADPANFSLLHKEMRRAAQFKECLYPDHSCCSNKIIRAHSIQNNKILSKIADDGKVYMPAMKAEPSFSMPREFGKKEASAFTGFCGFHDKTVFQPIEDKDFVGTEEQIFLYIYRAFALEYHKKREAVRMTQQMFYNMPSMINEGYLIRGESGFSMSVKDYEAEKPFFDNALLSKKYDILTSIVWVFEGYSNFAATNGEAPSRDFENNMIQDPFNPDIPMRHIYYSVFPENDKTFVIIAWLKQFDSLFSTIRKRLSDVNEDERRNFVNNTLAMTAENIVIKPSSWDAMSEVAKREFAMGFYAAPELQEVLGEKVNRFQKPTFDLFSL